MTIGESTFRHFSYDRDADVLYLSVGMPQPADRTFSTPERHAVRLDKNYRIIGITLVNVATLLEGGNLEVTLPQVVDVERSQLEDALAI